jgi:hypothetical protein
MGGVAASRGDFPSATPEWLRSTVRTIARTAGFLYDNFRGYGLQFMIYTEPAVQTQPWGQAFTRMRLVASRAYFLRPALVKLITSHVHRNGKHFGIESIRTDEKTR